MQLRSMGFMVMAAALVAASPALGDGTITVTRGQFTDRVENRLPVGNAAALTGLRQAIYWLELRNDTHAQGQVTLVWNVDGHVIHREPLTVLDTHVMRTWAYLPLHHSTHAISVQVLGPDGAQIFTDQTNLGGSSGSPAP